MQPKINRSFFLIFAIFVSLVLITPTHVWGNAQSSDTLEIRVIQGDDDAEELVSGGGMDLSSSDLELVRESGDQIIGIRFANVPIPKGSTITNAYILFTTDETDTEPTSLTIWGESSGDAKIYENIVNNISTRAKTSAVVDWPDVSGWGVVGETGVNQQSPDLTAIVQEIIDLPAWDFDKPIAFIIEGSGKRVAESYNGGGDTKAPLLHIEYTSNVVEIRISSDDDDAEERIDTTSVTALYSSDLDFRQDRLWGVRFPNVTVPQGAEITNAYIEFVADEVNTGTARVRIDVQEHDDAPMFMAIDRNISDRPLSGDPVDWNPMPQWNNVGEIHRTPDLSALVQKIVGRPGWVSGHAMVFVGEGMNYNRAAFSHDQDPALAPMLHIEYGEGEIGVDEPLITVNTTSLGGTCYQGSSPEPLVFTLTNTGTGKLQYTTSDDAAWVTLSSGSGELYTGDTRDITVNFNTTGLNVGTHEATILIEDPDALNNPVEIQVSVTVWELPDEMTCGHVPLYTENLVSPAILILLDVSGSMKTKMEVSASGNPQTPDLGPIVQEIVDRPGWTPGNAMAFMIEGGGRRTAVSYDGDSAAAPLLHVNYFDGSSDQSIEIRVSQSSDDAEEELGFFKRADTNNNDLEIVKKKSGEAQIVGLRFQNLQIPQGATITHAYIEFAIDESDTESTTWIIYGEDMDDPPTYAWTYNNISNRKKTNAATAWNDIPKWQGVTKEKRIDIGKAVISDLVKDRSISWGYGTWANRDPYKSLSDRTQIHVGTKPNDEAQQTALQDAIAATEPAGGTPFSFSIEAAQNYFQGAKADKEGTGDFYVESDCQPKFLIDITDGQGNSGSTVANTASRTQALADAGVSSVGVGFGLEYEDSEQLYEMTKWANIKGNESDADDLYALHEEISGVAEPFFAFNQEDLVKSLKQITESVKGAIFHGSAPAPTTSADLGDMVIVAHFDASRWAGDVNAVIKDTNKSSPTYGMWIKNVWTASEKMPVSRTLWTIDPSDVDAKTVIKYDESTLANDSFVCFLTKPIGDIINSTPVVVGYPPFSYGFDEYRDFKYGTKRDTMIYIGANDGSVHAFDLSTGVEQWAFVPKSMHWKLDAAGTNPLYDRCSSEYCHQYYMDGSPIVGDVYAKFDGIIKEWRTVLVIGEREGGEAYVALDVTSGKGFDDLDPTKFLWEFTDDQLGQTWSDSTIDRVEIDAVDPATETAWGVFFGSGYSTTDQESKQAYLFGILAHDAGMLWKDADSVPINRILVGDPSVYKVTVKDYPEDQPSQHFDIGEIVKGQSTGTEAKVIAIERIMPKHAILTLDDLTGDFNTDEQIKGNPNTSHWANFEGNVTGEGTTDDALASPLTVDMEADYIADRIYVGNLYGNMYRISNIGKDMTPQVTTLFTSNNTSPYINPIRAKADFAYSEMDDEVWIYFGTGRYEDQSDKLDTNQQYFFGLKDGVTPAATYTPEVLVTLQGKFVVADIDGKSRTLRYVDGDNEFAEPWKMQLYEGTFPDGPLSSGSERVISRPLAVAGMVLFTTFIPDENICAGSGETWVFAVDYKSGLAATEPVFDLNGDGKFDDNDKVEIDGKLVVPIGIKAGRGQGSPPVLHKDTLFITTTGSGEEGDGGDFFAQTVNLRQQKIKVEAWREN